MLTVQERTIHRKLYSLLPNACKRYFPKIHKYDKDQRGRHIIVIDYIEGETLYEYLNRGIDIGRKKDLLRNIQSAIKCMWKSGIVHGDLHVKNVMVNPRTGDITIIDFGFAIHVKKFTNAINRKGINKWINQTIPEFIKNKTSVGNPEFIYFGLTTPIYNIRTTAPRLERLVKNVGYEHERPYTRIETLKKIARTIALSQQIQGFSKHYKMKKMN